MLKPALARGEIQCIGATTLDEYRKYIEKDSALDRRFQLIMVEPATKEEAVEILKGLRDRYEEHHRVKYSDDALESAVELSTRYITGRCLPDKAIDVIDEAGATGAAAFHDASTRSQRDRRRGRTTEQGERRRGRQSGFREGRRTSRSSR